MAPLTRSRIYLDNHATTRVDPRVLEAMMPFFGETYGNASSRSHSYGWEARTAIEEARQQIAALVRADPKEIYFTSGATESVNLAIAGAVAAAPANRRHILTTATEHRAVLETCLRLAHATGVTGVSATVLEVPATGLLDLAQLRAAIREDTLLVALAAANGEIGVIQDLPAVSDLCRSHGILLLTDAAQAVGRIPIDVGYMGVDMLAMSGHKMYGPKGIGVLFVRRDPAPVPLRPMLHGGGQERGLRSGTVPTPLAVGLGAAAVIASVELDAEASRLLRLRDRLWVGLGERLHEIEANGDMQRRLPGNLNIYFAGVDADELLLAIPDLAVSSGSACDSGRAEPSHVLLALVGRERAGSSLRFGLGRFTTDEEIEEAIRLIADAVNRLRGNALRN